eukprot:scaffold4623_cov202-Prasinococcus_capsulatus_cf.AAC.1
MCLPLTDPLVLLALVPSSVAFGALAALAVEAAEGRHPSPWIVPASAIPGIQRLPHVPGASLVAATQERTR